MVREATAGCGAELVLDIVGSDETIALAAQCGRSEGDVTIVGLAGGTFGLSFFSQPYECSISTTYWGSDRADRGARSRSSRQDPRSRAALSAHAGRRCLRTPARRTDRRACHGMPARVTDDPGVGRAGNTQHSCGLARMPTGEDCGTLRASALAISKESR